MYYMYPAFGDVISWTLSTNGENGTGVRRHRASHRLEESVPRRLR